MTGRTGLLWRKVRSSMLCTKTKCPIVVSSTPSHESESIRLLPKPSVSTKEAVAGPNIRCISFEFTFINIYGEDVQSKHNTLKNLK